MKKIFSIIFLILMSVSINAKAALDHEKECNSLIKTFQAKINQIPIQDILDVLIGAGIAYVIYRIIPSNGINIQIGQNIPPLKGFKGLNIQIGKKLTWYERII
jgi:hypothetical protein